MYICLMYSKELLKGTLQTIILNLLDEHGKMYGYEITRKVMEISKEEVKLTEGALYPSLHKLESQGLLITQKVSIGKRVRKYYLPTETGKAEAQKKREEFWDFVNTMGHLLKPKMN